MSPASHPLFARARRVGPAVAVVPRGAILAALAATVARFILPAFRAIYHLLPFALGCALLATVELGRRCARGQSA